jgi:retron-type reverse transcriptase
MKRHGQLFDRCFSADNLYAAYLDARKGKRAKRAVFEFEKRLGPNLAELRAEILTGTYRPRPYFSFTVQERKPRLIHAPAFRDVVAQHAIYRVVYPLFDRTFIDQSYACRKGKGTHRCADYVQRALRQYPGGRFTLHLDVRRFFYQIDRDRLMILVGRVIKDQRLLAVMALYAEHGEPLGIPIGNLLSQLYALIYLNPVDHYVKRVLKVRHYARYVDDLLLIGLTRAEALAARDAIADFLRERLGLSLSKAGLALVNRGVNFVGYRTWRSTRFVRRHSLHQFGRALRRGRVASLTSLMGHAQHTGTLCHYRRRIVREHPDLIPFLPHFAAAQARRGCA